MRLGSIFQLAVRMCEVGFLEAVNVYSCNNAAFFESYFQAKIWFCWLQTEVYYIFLHSGLLTFMYKKALKFHVFQCEPKSETEQR